MLEHIVILCIVGVVAWKRHNTLSHPFNEFGYDTYIKDPLRQIKYRQEFFKDIQIYPWDLCNLHEIVFAAFEAYCKKPWGDEFVLRAVQNGKYCPLWEEEVSQSRYQIFLRLEQIKEYVLHTRRTNQATLEYITNLIVHETTLGFDDAEDFIEDGEKWCRLRTKSRNYYLKGEYWLDGSELKHNIEKTDEEHATKLSWFDIEQELADLDTAYAKELLEYRDYIWD